MKDKDGLSGWQEAIRGPLSREIIPLPSDAPAVTIARLSVELAAARADVARMAEALKPLASGERITFADEKAARLALASTPDHIAISRAHFDRMVKALGMGDRLNECALRVGYAIYGDIRNAQTASDSAACVEILDEMKAASNV